MHHESVPRKLPSSPIKGCLSSMCFSSPMLFPYSNALCSMFLCALIQKRDQTSSLLTLVFSRSLDDHLKHFTRTILCIQEAGLKLKSAKYHFFRNELEYLGHLITLLAKSTIMSAVKKFPPPRNIRESCSVSAPGQWPSTPRGLCQPSTLSI